MNPASGGLLRSPVSFTYGQPGGGGAHPASGFGGFLQSLLPTIGSLGGMALGSVVAPGIGTAAGGAGGGILGQKIEDMLTGQNSGLGTYALQGGLGALGGIGKAAEAIGGATNAARAGESLGNVASTLRFGTRGAQEVAPGASLAENAISATNANAGRGLGVSAAGRAAGKAGSQAMLSGVGSVGKKTAEALIPNISDMRSLGYSDIGKMAGDAPTVSGPEGALTTLRDQMVHSPNARPVDASNFMDVVKQNINVGLTDSEERRILSRVTAIADRHGLSGVSAPGITPADNIQAAMREIGAIPTSSVAAKKTVNSIYGSLRQAVNDSTAGVAITDSMKGQVVSALRSAGVGTPQLIKAVRGASSWGDLAQIESKFVNASRAVQEGEVNAVRGGIPGLAPGSKPTLTGMVNQAAGTVARKAVSKGAGTIENMIGRATPSEVSSVPGIMGQAIKGGVKAQALPRLLTGGLQAEQQAGQQASAATPDMSQLGATGTTAPSPQGAGNATGFTPDSIQQAMMADLALTGGKHMSALTSIYNTFVGPKAGQLPTDLQTRHDNINAALSALDAAESNLTVGGGAKGALGATAKIPFLGQYLDNAGTAYEKTKLDTATQLAKAVTGNSRAPANIVQGFISSLPDVTDTPQQASAKLAMIRNELFKQAGQFGFNDLTQGAQ